MPSNHEEKYLEAIKALREEGELVTPQKINNKLKLGRGALRDIEKFLLQRQQKRDAAVELLFTGVSEEFALATAQEMDRVFRVRAMPLKQECEQKDLKLAAMQTELAATRAREESLQTELARVQEAFKQARESWLSEQGKLEGLLEAAQHLNREQTQVLGALRQAPLPHPMLDSLQDVLQQVANALEENNRQRTDRQNSPSSFQVGENSSVLDKGEPPHPKSKNKLSPEKKMKSTPEDSGADNHSNAEDLQTTTPSILNGPATDQVIRKRAEGDGQPSSTLPP